MITQKAIDFLKESNLIESVNDEDSLQQAIYAWNYLCEQKELTLGVVLKLHKILMLHQPLMPDERGYFRTVPVYIGGHEAMQHEFIRENLTILLEDMNYVPKDWKNHHIVYEAIHPFVDGNGRTGRMFMNWERMKAGLKIKVIKYKDRWSYYEWFNPVGN